MSAPKQRVLVTGGREWGDLSRSAPQRLRPQREWERAQVFKALDEIAKVSAHFPLGERSLVIIAGAATGADTCAADWATVNWCEVVAIKADWNDLEAPGAIIRRRVDGSLYNAKAGPLRNKRLLTEGRPDLVLAFPGARGTRNMINLARAAGVPVTVCCPEQWEGKLP